MDLHCYEDSRNIILENLRDIENIHINNSDNNDYYHLVPDKDNISYDILNNDNEFMDLLDSNMIDILDQYIINDNNIKNIDEKDMKVQPLQSGNNNPGDIKYDTYNLSYNNQEINNIPLESMIKIIENINYFQDISNALITLSNRYGSEYIKTLPVHTLLHLVNYVVANDKAVKAINYWNSIAYAYQ